MPIITQVISVMEESKEQRQLAIGLTKAVQEVTGVSIDHIFL